MSAVKSDETGPGDRLTEGEAFGAFFKKDDRLIPSESDRLNGHRVRAAP